MLSVRLQRVGRKNDPSFRMVIIDSKRGVKSANYVEMVGSYNPRQKTVDVKVDRIKYWISQGAKPTDTVHNILINQKVIEGKKVNPLGKKTPIVKKEEEEKGKAAEPKAETKAVSEDGASASEKKTEAETEVTDAPEEDKKEETSKEKSEEEPETPEEEPKVAKAEPVDNSATETAQADSAEKTLEDKKDKAEGEA